MSRPSSIATKSASSAAFPAAANEFTSAKFWRCALQVNPAGYSAAYRGQTHGLDEDAYNQALLDTCLELGIKVVGIADHGSVDAVDKLRDTLCSKNIVVFPGFEIASTEKVHMVCLFPEETDSAKLNQYIGELGLASASDATRPSRYGCLDLAKRVCDLGGFWYAAHTTGANGLLRLGNNDGGGLTHIWTDPCVRVAQIPGGIDGLRDNYQKIVTNENPDYRRERPIAVINARDVAKPVDLREPGASTWIKMTRPTFDAFKIAFLDPESRVRLDLASEPHSALVSLRVQGGYLDGLHAQFSEHLNALIGGRGTGKSTLLECIRYALELPPKGKQAIKLHQDILKENLGKSSGTIELQVRSQTQHGKLFTISRRYGEPPIVRDEAGVVSQQQPRDLLPSIEIYGQNEIFELAQDSDSRLRLLDRFLPTALPSEEARASLQKKLTENTARLLKAESDKDENAELVGKLPKLQEQLEGFRKLGIETKLARVPLYAREKQLVARVDEELTRVQGAVDALTECLPDIAFLSDKALEGLPDAACLSPMRLTLESLRGELSRQQQSLQQAVAQAKTEKAAAHATWQAALSAGESDLEATFASLPDLAGKSGREVGTAYKQLSQEIERIQPLQAKDVTFTQLAASLRADRQNLVAELSDLRGKRSVKLSDAVKGLNQRLRGKIRIALTVEGDREPLKRFLIGCKLENVGERRLSWIEDSAVTPLALARAIEQGEDALKSAFGMTAGVASALAKLPKSQLLELESVELGDLVDIELNVAHGEPENYRALSRLSTGQQCTAVLHLLLLDNRDPLIVDQPEDNLDNAFIAERIVHELRASKTERQFLFSTHNANIPVFGDAEWIGVLTAEENRGVLEPTHQGSIDVPEIRQQAAQILEGGPSAFNQRKEMYGF